MRFYHGTRTPGLAALVPGADGKVYLAARRAVAALYIWDFDRNPCKWMGYRIIDGDVVYLEYFPGALAAFYGGVSGYLYSCEGEYPLNDKLSLAAGVEGEVPLDACEEIPDVLDFILSLERAGELEIRLFENLTDEDCAYVRETVWHLIENLDLNNHPENPYHAFVRDRFQDVWITHPFRDRAHPPRCAAASQSG